MQLNLRKELLILLVSLTPFVMAWYFWDLAPDPMPTHWGIDGKVNDYSSKSFGLLFFPCIGLVLYLVLRFAPQLDPRKRNLELIAPSFQNLRLAIAVFVVAMYYMVVDGTIQGDVSINRIFTLVLLLFAFIGNYLRSIRPNYLIGIRTPWTLESEEVWKKTHNLAGRLWFYGALALAPISYFASLETLAWIVFPALGIIVLLPIILSYFLYKKKQNSN